MHAHAHTTHLVRYSTTCDASFHNRTRTTSRGNRILVAHDNSVPVSHGNRILVPCNRSPVPIARSWRIPVDHKIHNREVRSRSCLFAWTYSRRLQSEAECVRAAVVAHATDHDSGIVHRKIFRHAQTSEFLPKTPNSDPIVYIAIEAKWRCDWRHTTPTMSQLRRRVTRVQVDNSHVIVNTLDKKLFRSTDPCRSCAVILRWETQIKSTSSEWIKTQLRGCSAEILTESVASPAINNRAHVSRPTPRAHNTSMRVF